MWPAPYVCFDNWDVLVASKMIKYVLKRSDACVLCLEMTFLMIKYVFKTFECFIVPWNDVFTHESRQLNDFCVISVRSVTIE